MKAICFECGKEKSEAMKLCRHCNAMPISRREKILSVCLSSDCLRQHNLVFSQDHLFRRGIPPGFRRSVVRAAIRIVEKMPDNFQVSPSFEFFEEPQNLLMVE